MNKQKFNNGKINPMLIDPEIKRMAEMSPELLEEFEEEEIISKVNESKSGYKSVPIPKKSKLKNGDLVKVTKAIVI